MITVRDKRNGKLYHATIGTEFTRDWYSCYPIEYTGPGFPIALAPEWVEVIHTF